MTSAATGSTDPPEMRALRYQIAKNPALAAMILAAAMLLRVIVPAGFMPEMSSGRIAIVICSGYGTSSTMMMAMPGMDAGQSTADQHQGDHRSNDHHGGAEMPCGFSALSLPGLSGADPILLVLAIAAIMALAIGASPRLAIAPIARSRPPLRAPPILA